MGWERFPINTFIYSNPSSDEFATIGNGPKSPLALQIIR